MIVTLFIATEDELSETVARKLVEDAGGEDIRPLRKGGNGYLRRSIGRFAELAARFPVLLLADLDEKRCAPALIADWAAAGAPSRLLFRVVVREIEAWLLADREEIAEFLGISAAKIELNTETIGDPKRRLLDLAGKGRRDIRRDILPKSGSKSVQGFGYNPRLCEFVRKCWSSERAAPRNDSLARTIARLNELKASIPWN